MGVICKYKFDSSIYADFIPEFNSGYSGYVITDEVERNIITRTIESDELPTLMRFGRVWVEGESTTDNRTDSLLEVLDLNTSGLTSCSNMFRYNKNLTSITCEWDTSNVTNMNSMFADCYKLTSLDVSNFNTNNVTDMSYMFTGCNILTSLDVSNWDTSNVTTTNSMFYNCNKLTTLDVSNFNTSSVTIMAYMFTGCNNLTSLDLNNFDTSKVTSIYGMFSNCTNLTSVDVSNFNTSNVTRMDAMFNGCTSLTSLDLSNFDTSNVINMKGMFHNCKNLASLDLSNFDTSNVTDTTNMFARINSLEVITMFNSNINTINTIGNLTSATIYVDESLDQSQYTGTAPLKVYKEEKLEIKLNSPLLEEDTIEVVDGKLCHVHRMNRMVLDGSEDWKQYSDNQVNNIGFYFEHYLNTVAHTCYCSSIRPSASDYMSGELKNDRQGIFFHYQYIKLSINKSKLLTQNVDGFKQWLSQNPLTIIYKLKEPIYEDITPLQSSLVLKTFLESSMIINTILPIETKLSYRTNVPSISTLSTRATELAESDNVIHNLMNIIDDEVDE